MRFNDFFRFEFLLYAYFEYSSWARYSVATGPALPQIIRNAMDSLLAVVSNTSNAHGIFVVKRFVLKYCVKHVLKMKNFTTPSAAPVSVLESPEPLAQVV